MSLLAVSYLLTTNRARRTREEPGHPSG